MKWPIIRLDQPCQTKQGKAPSQVRPEYFGRLATPFGKDDAIAIRAMMYLSLSFDHRVLDWAQADVFLRKIKDNLEGWGGQPQAPRPAQERGKYEKVPGTESGYGGVW